MSKLLFFLFIFSLAILSCKEKIKNRRTIDNKTTKPDPNIEVKDDYTQLTKADEEKEDKSHMDISYFPSNYALNKALNNNIDLKLRVIYSRPHKGNRSQIFGNDTSLLVPYGKLWRMGANETTEIEVLKPIEIDGKKINVGRYSLYAIPKEKSWTIIFNKDIHTFGAFNYIGANDVAKAEATVMKRKFSLETFLIYFQKTNEGCNMICTWDTEVASLPIKFL